MGWEALQKRRPMRPEMAGAVIWCGRQVRFSQAKSALNQIDSDHLVSLHLSAQVMWQCSWRTFSLDQHQTIWLASYPRSGNTFLRIVLAQVFGLKTASVYENLTTYQFDRGVWD